MPGARAHRRIDSQHPSSVRRNRMLEIMAPKRNGTMVAIDDRVRTCIIIRNEKYDMINYGITESCHNG